MTQSGKIEEEEDVMRNSTSVSIRYGGKGYIA